MSMAGRCIAASTVSGMFVGPGMLRNWRPLETVMASILSRVGAPLRNFPRALSPRQRQRVEIEAVLPFADMANARAGAGEALRFGRGLERHLDRRRDGHEGPDRRHRRVHRLLGDQPVLDDLLIGLGGLEDDARAVQTGEVAAA